MTDIPMLCQTYVGRKELIEESQSHINFQLTEIKVQSKRKVKADFSDGTHIQNSAHQIITLFSTMGDDFKRVSP